MTAVVRRGRNVFDVTADGVTPLDYRAIAPLLPGMEYAHRRHLRGREAARAVCPETGRAVTSRVVVEPRRLYGFDDAGRLQCPSGYTDRVVAGLRAAGYEVAIVEVDPPDPARLEPDWSRLEARPEFHATAADVAELERLWAAGARGTDLPVALVRRVKQSELVRRLARRVARRYGGVIQAPPGLGKSFVMAAIALVYPRATIGCVVPGADNFHKTLAHLTKYQPTGAVGHGQARHERVTVYSLQSAHKIDDATDLLLVDEAHEAGADAASESLAATATRAVRFGLTATPAGRIDGTDARLEALFGPIVWAMTWPEATALGLVLPIEARWIRTDFAANPIDDLAPSRRGDDHWRKKVGIWGHDARNAAFARVARRHRDAGDQVLVLVEKIEHALHLARHLGDFALVYGEQDVAYWSKYARDEGLVGEGFEPLDRRGRERLRLAFAAGTVRGAIATDVWSQGVSFDALAVVLRADARAAPIRDEQIPGRASRVDAASGKQKGILYDATDGFDPGFGGRARRRRANYRDKGWEQCDATP